MCHIYIILRDALYVWCLIKHSDTLTVLMISFIISLGIIFLFASVSDNDLFTSLSPSLECVPLIVSLSFGTPSALLRLVFGYTPLLVAVSKL